MTHDLQHWSDEERILLDAVLNQLIPANEDRGIPAAGKIGIADDLGSIAVRDAESGRLFESGLICIEQLAADAGGIFGSLDHTRQVAVIRKIEETEPGFFKALIRHTYMAYYSRPDIRAALGLSDKPVHPDGYEVPREMPEFMSELTAPVRRRGPVYRDC